jgi:hypothetical protein
MRGDSGFHHHAVNAGWHPRGDELRRHHPSREVKDGTGEERQVEGGYHLHIFEDEGGAGWAVWFNTEVSNFDGLCIGTGTTRAEALQVATNVLTDALKQIEERP